MVSLSGLLFTCAHTKMSLLKTCKNKKASDETNLIKFSVQEELPESSAPTVHPTSSERGVEGWNIQGAPGPERLGTLAPPERVRGAACLGEWVPELSSSALLELPGAQSLGPHPTAAGSAALEWALQSEP